MFKKQNSADDQETREPEIRNQVSELENDSILNNHITENEIAQVITNLKNNKSPGRDNILNELILKNWKRTIIITPRKVI